METTRGGKPFQTRAAATGSAWSPIIERFDRGTTSAAGFADHNRSRGPSSATRLNEAEWLAGQFRVDSVKHSQPDGKLFSLGLVYPMKFTDWGRIFVVLSFQIFEKCGGALCSRLKSIKQRVVRSRSSVFQTRLEKTSDWRPGLITERRLLRLCKAFRYS